MRIEIKNLREPVMQTPETLAEIERIEDALKSGEDVSVEEQRRLRSLKKYGTKYVARNKCLHPEPEQPAVVPTIDNPEGVAPSEEEEKKTVKMVSEVSASGKERKYDEDGDPLPFDTEELNDKSFKRIIKEIKSGVNPYQACVNKRIVPHQFFDGCRKNGDWAQQLNEAREVYCESQVARLEKLAKQVEKGTIDVAIYSSVCSNIKWLIEKLFPQVYGSKAQVQNIVTHEISVDQKKLKELNDLLRGKDRAIPVEFKEIK